MMMPSPIILDRVRGCVARGLRRPVDRLPLDVTLHDLGVRAFEVVEVLIELEIEFGIAMPDCPAEGEAPWTVHRLAGLVAGIVARRQAA